MASAIASCDEIRFRLRMSAAELPDTVLESASFIPAAEAILSSKGIVFASLSSNQQALAKAAFIALVAAAVAIRPPDPGGKYGPIEIKGTTATDAQKAALSYEREAERFLRVLGIKSGAGYFVISGQGSTQYDEAADLL